MLSDASVLIPLIQMERQSMDGAGRPCEGVGGLLVGRKVGMWEEAILLI